MPGDHKQKKKVKDLREKLGKAKKTNKLSKKIRKESMIQDVDEYYKEKKGKLQKRIAKIRKADWESMQKRSGRKIHTDEKGVRYTLSDDGRFKFHEPVRINLSTTIPTGEVERGPTGGKHMKEVVSFPDSRKKAPAKKKGKIRKADVSDINRVTRWDERTFNKRREMPKKREEDIEIDRSDVELHPYQAIAKLRNRLAKVENYKAESDPEASPGEWLSEYKKKRKSKVRKADGGIAPNFVPTESHDRKKKKKQKTALKKKGRLTSDPVSNDIKTPKNKQYLERRKKKDYVKNANKFKKARTKKRPKRKDIEIHPTGYGLTQDQPAVTHDYYDVTNRESDHAKGRMYGGPEVMSDKVIAKSNRVLEKWKRRHFKENPKTGEYDVPIKESKIRRATEIIDPREKKKKTVRPDSNVQKVSKLKQRIAEMKVDKDHNHKIQFRVHEGSQYRRASLAKQEGKYAKYWLLNAKQTNGNGWGVSQTSIAKNISKFIGRPFVITAKQWVAESEYGDQFEHPYLPTNNISQIINHQEKFRVGSIVDVIEKDGDYHAVIEMNSKFANMMLPPFCSPAIFQNNPGEADGQISDWEALHLAGLMEDPAYGARIALLKGSCVGTADACSVQFKSAKQAKMVCPKKMKNLKGRLGSLETDSVKNYYKKYEGVGKVAPGRVSRGFQTPTLNKKGEGGTLHHDYDFKGDFQHKYEKKKPFKGKAKDYGSKKSGTTGDPENVGDILTISESNAERWAKLRGRLAGVIKPKKADSVDGTIDKLVKEVKDPANKEDLVKRLGTTPNEHGPKNYGATKAKDFSSRKKVSKKKQKIAVKKPAWDEGFDRHCVTCDNALTDAEVKYEMRGGCSKGPGRCTSHRLRTKKSKVRRAMMPPEDPLNWLQHYEEEGFVEKKSKEGYNFPVKQLKDESKAVSTRNYRKKVNPPKLTRPSRTGHGATWKGPGTSAAYTTLKNLEKGAKTSKLKQRLAIIDSDQDEIAGDLNKINKDTENLRTKRTLGIDLKKLPGNDLEARWQSLTDQRVQALHRYYAGDEKALQLDNELEKLQADVQSEITTRATLGTPTRLSDPKIPKRGKGKIAKLRQRLATTFGKIGPDGKVRDEGSIDINKVDSSDPFAYSVGYSEGARGDNIDTGDAKFDGHVMFNYDDSPEYIRGWKEGNSFFRKTLKKTRGKGKISKLRQRLVRTAKPIIQETGEGITFKKVDPKIYGKKTYGYHKVPMHPSNTVLIRPKDPKNFMDLVNHFRKIHETHDFAKYTQGSVQQTIPLHSLKNDIRHMSGDKLKFHADISTATNKAFKKGDILMRRVGGTPEKGKYGTVGETFYIEEDSPVGEVFNAPSKYKRHGKLRSATIKPLTKKKKKGKAIRKVSSKSK